MLLQMRKHHLSRLCGCAGCVWAHVFICVCTCVHGDAHGGQTQCRMSFSVVFSDLFVCLCFTVLGIKMRPQYMLHQHSSLGLYSHPSIFLFCFVLFAFVFLTECLTALEVSSCCCRAYTLNTIFRSHAGAGHLKFSPGA